MLAGLMSPPPDDGPDPLAPEHVTPLVTYLASPAAERINGEVFVVHGGVAAVLNPPSLRAVFHADTPDGMWTLPAIHGALASEFAASSPDSPGFACLETMTLASETIGFDS
jgi:3-oxoacyl-[acyl-carrier protein] reductase